MMKRVLLFHLKRFVCSQKGERYMYHIRNKTSFEIIRKAFKMVTETSHSTDKQDKVSLYQSGI